MPFILYLSFMHKFPIIGLLVTLLLGCQPDIGSRQVDPALDAGRLKTALHERKDKDDLMPFPDALLRQILPATLEGFPLTETKSASFREEFAEVERVYYQDEGYYLQSRLSDYEASPRGFEQIWKNFESFRQAESGQIVDPHVQHFCWQHIDTVSRVFHRECGLAYRFHLQLRSNHPRADSIFDRLQTAISIPTTLP
jgi:hypothetical protein